MLRRLALICLLAIVGLPAAETLSVSFKTSQAGGNRAPLNIVAVWVETSTGTFVKTIGDWSQTRRSDLTQWRAKAGTSDTDAVMGATRNDHTATLTVTWDMTYRGGAAAGDGAYKIWFETVDTDAGTSAGTTSVKGANRFSFAFTKNGVPVSTPQAVTDAAGKYTAITWTYTGRVPTVASLSPSAGGIAGGTATTITGTNFAAGATVTIGGTAATGISVVNTTTITCTTPAHAVGAADVAVTSLGQTATLTGGFTYVATPTVTAIAPTSGSTAGGTAVTVTGTNFATGATVTIGGTAATAVSVTNATTLTCTTPAHAAGAADVVVTVSGQSGTGTGLFTYVAPPTVVTVSPTGGPTTGGTSVTITGTGFASGATVTFGGTAATAVSVTNATSLTCTAPAHAAGAVSVVVTVGGLSGTKASAYTYAVAAGPTIASITPNSGLVGGGGTATITGTGFASGATVTFGGTVATGVSVSNATTLTCTIPAHAAGAVDVVVTVSAQSGTSAGGYTYVAIPTVTSASPATGGTGGGTTVTITGTNFVSGATVTFGGTAATGVSVTSATSLTCTAPAHAAGTVDVVVSYLGQSGTGTGIYAYVAQPTVTSAAPSTGSTAGGGTVVVSGTNFASGATVTFGGTAATGVSVSNATSLTCTAPAHAAGAVAVAVTVSGASGSLAGAYTYVTAPTVSAISPSSGLIDGGDVVTVTGTGFTGSATVTIGGTAATNVTINSATQLTCMVPAHAAGAAAVAVTVSGVSGSLAGAYTYVAAPTVANVSPATGTSSGGTSVTITGTNFVAGATVAFGGVAATGVVVNSATSISCTTPAHAAMAVDVDVTVLGITGTGTAAFTFVNPPTVSGAAPANGPTTGGATVVVSGTGFASGATVSFGGVAATAVNVSGSTSLTCTAPAHAAGAVDIAVTVGGLSGTAPGVYTYVAPVTGAPVITAVSPAAGGASGGTLVTIDGTNFASGATVSFGGVAATGLTVVSATRLTCTAPAHATGGVDVAVTVGGQTWTSLNAFTYTGAAGVMYVGFNTSAAGGSYAPKHVLAVWIEDGSGGFVKTIGDWSATRRSNLTQWQAKSGGSDADAILGATRLAHAPVANVSWNLQGKDSTVSVVDGNYRLWIELVDDNAPPAGTVSAGAARRTSVQFTIAGGAVSDVGPLTQDGFSNITITTAPTAVPMPASSSTAGGVGSCGGSAIYGLVLMPFVLLRRRRRG